MESNDDAAEPASITGPLARALEASDQLALIWLSPRGAITGWQGAAERLFGYTAAEVIGQPFTMLFTPEDREQGIDRLEVLLAQETGRSEDDRWHQRKNGSRFWANGLLLRCADEADGRRGFAKLLRDRTDKRIRDDAITNRIAALSRDLAHRDERLLTLLHEVRNPLATLMNVAHVLSTAASEDARRRMVEVLLRQTQVLERLVLDAAASASGATARVELTSVEVRAALQVAVDGLRQPAESKRLTLRLFVPDTPVVMQADAQLLQRMLHNLIGNAVKYTPDGGTVTVSGSTEGSDVVIRVEDDGVGISPENLGRIFQLFTRELSESAPVEGFGIGLAVVRQLADLHGGFVEARSPGKGRGSQFKLQLPLVPPEHSGLHLSA